VRIINLKSNQHFQGLKKYFSNYLLNLKYWSNVIFVLLTARMWHGPWLQLFMLKFYYSTLQSNAMFFLIECERNWTFEHEILVFNTASWKREPNRRASCISNNILKGFMPCKKTFSVYLIYESITFIEQNCKIPLPKMFRSKNIAIPSFKIFIRTG